MIVESLVMPSYSTGYCESIATIGALVAIGQNGSEFSHTYDNVLYHILERPEDDG